MNTSNDVTHPYNYEYYHALDAAANYGESASFHAHVTLNQHAWRNEAAYMWAREAAHAAFTARPDLRG